MPIPPVKLGAFHEWARFEARGARLPRDGRALGPLARRVLAAAAKFLLLATLPFLVLVRVSVLLYSRLGFPWWLALTLGLGCTVLVVTAYGAWLSHRLTRRARALTLARRVALPLVLAYAGYTLIYLSSANAKSEQVRAFYSSLHPLLRVALSTWILFDRDVVITDLARRPEDYGAMGLAARGRSRHYLQSDGYVHAADLRTSGRGFVENRVAQMYFWSMGFETGRHGGTADHLHVELPLP